MRKLRILVMLILTLICVTGLGVCSSFADEPDFSKLEDGSYCDQAVYYVSDNSNCIHHDNYFIIRVTSSEVIDINSTQPPVIDKLQYCPDYSKFSDHICYFYYKLSETTTQPYGGELTIPNVQCILTGSIPKTFSYETSTKPQYYGTVSKVEQIEGITGANQYLPEGYVLYPNYYTDNYMTQNTFQEIYMLDSGKVVSNLNRVCYNPILDIYCSITESKKYSDSVYIRNIGGSFFPGRYYSTLIPEAFKNLGADKLGHADFLYSRNTYNNVNYPRYYTKYGWVPGGYLRYEKYIFPFTSIDVDGSVYVSSTNIDFSTIVNIDNIWDSMLRAYGSVENIPGILRQVTGLNPFYGCDLYQPFGTASFRDCKPDLGDNRLGSLGILKSSDMDVSCIGDNNTEYILHPIKNFYSLCVSDDVNCNYIGYFADGFKYVWKFDPSIGEFIGVTLNGNEILAEELKHIKPSDRLQQYACFNGVSLSSEKKNGHITYDVVTDIIVTDKTSWKKPYVKYNTSNGFDGTTYVPTETIVETNYGYSIKSKVYYNKAYTGSPYLTSSNLPLRLHWADQEVGLVNTLSQTVKKGSTSIMLFACEDANVDNVSDFNYCVDSSTGDKCISIVYNDLYIEALDLDVYGIRPISSIVEDTIYYSPSTNTVKDMPGSTGKYNERVYLTKDRQYLIDLRDGKYDVPGYVYSVPFGIYAPSSYEIFGFGSDLHVKSNTRTNICPMNYHTLNITNITKATEAERSIYTFKNNITFYDLLKGLSYEDEADTIDTTKLINFNQVLNLSGDYSIEVTDQPDRILVSNCTNSMFKYDYDSNFSLGTKLYLDTSKSQESTISDLVSHMLYGRTPALNWNYAPFMTDIIDDHVYVLYIHLNKSTAGKPVLLDISLNNRHDTLNDITCYVFKGVANIAAGDLSVESIIAIGTLGEFKPSDTIQNSMEIPFVVSTSINSGEPVIDRIYRNTTPTIYWCLDNSNYKFELGSSIFSVREDTIKYKDSLYIDPIVKDPFDQSSANTLRIVKSRLPKGTLYYELGSKSLPDVDTYVKSDILSVEPVYEDEANETIVFDVSNLAVPLNNISLLGSSNIIKIQKSIDGNISNPIFLLLTKMDEDTIKDIHEGLYVKYDLDTLKGLKTKGLIPFGPTFDLNSFYIPLNNDELNSKYLFKDKTCGNLQVNIDTSLQNTAGVLNDYLQSVSVSYQQPDTLKSDLNSDFKIDIEDVAECLRILRNKN